MDGNTEVGRLELDAGRRHTSVVRRCGGGADPSLHDHLDRNDELRLGRTDELVAQRKDYDTSTEAFALRRALNLLPPEYREPLLMQVIYGYSQEEIARHLGISSAGAGTRLFRARKKMRALL